MIAAELVPQRFAMSAIVSPDLTVTLTGRGASFAGSTFAGSLLAGSLFTGSTFAASVFAGPLFAGSTFAGSLFAGSTLAGSAFAGSGFAGVGAIAAGVGAATFELFGDKAAGFEDDGAGASVALSAFGSFTALAYTGCDGWSVCGCGSVVRRGASEAEAFDGIDSRSGAGASSLCTGVAIAARGAGFGAIEGITVWARGSGELPCSAPGWNVRLSRCAPCASEPPARNA